MNQSFAPRAAADLRPGAMPLVMGVVNVTPDSFSDGGRFDSLDAAIDQGLRLRDEGAALVDVGGESTRPGATRPVASEELSRVLPVITALTQEGVAVSVDTMRPAVAAAALEAGAVVVNDVSGGLADPDILSVVAEAEAIYIAMHWRAHAEQMQAHADYEDVLAEVCTELELRVHAAIQAGIAAERLVVDPGLGFAKRPEHNWQLLADLDAVQALGYPVLVGASRKSFLGILLGDSEGPRPVKEREAGTQAISAWAAQRDVWGLRVHQVRDTVDTLKVIGALRDGGLTAHSEDSSENRGKDSGDDGSKDGGLSDDWTR